MTPAELLALFASDIPAFSKGADEAPITYDPHTKRVDEARDYVQSLVDAICDALLSGSNGPAVSLASGLRGKTQWSLYRYRQNGWTSTKAGKKVDASAIIAAEILDSPTELVRACFYVACIHVGIQTGVKLGTVQGRYFKASIKTLCESLELDFAKVKHQEAGVHGIYGHLPRSFRPLVKRFDVQTLKTRGCRPDGMSAVQFLAAIEDARADTVAPEQKLATATCSNETEYKLRLSDARNGVWPMACMCGCSQGFAVAENAQGTVIAVPVDASEVAVALAGKAAA